MAIDRMKKLFILSPVATAHRLNRTLYELGAVEVVDASEALQDANGVLSRGESTSEESDDYLSRINFILALANEYQPEQKNFFQGLTPLPLLVQQDDLANAFRQTDLKTLHREAQSIEDERKRIERRVAEIETQCNELAPFEQVPYDLASVRRLSRVRVVFGTVQARGLDALTNDPSAREVLLCESIDGASPRAASQSNAIPVSIAYLPNDEDAARRVLAAHQFQEIQLPHFDGVLRDRLTELRADRAVCDEELEKVRARAIALAKHRRHLEVLRAHWSGVRRMAVARGATLEGRWVHVVTGYCRERDLGRVEASLRSAVPESALIAEDPRPDDDVPVSITLPALVRPVYLLIKMFGLPPYSSFDPSPYVILPFYLFFGICFGDVGYGLLLILLGFYLSRKTKSYEGVYYFSQLLYFAGFSTVVFGVLLGSWFGDLPDAKYLGENNLLLQAKDSLMLLDPLKDPVSMLLIALGIGICVQLYGVLLKMHGAAKSRDWAAVAFDGMLWLIALPGLVLLIGNFLGALGPMFATAGKLLFLTGVVGLVLTQGRGEKGLLLKGINGLVSIYGILGSYGCAAFIGDTLSYCRLLALGLTTSIVAMCVNMIGGLVRDIDYVGPVLFIIVLVFGHLFNFIISLLGAFVHSMRLIFVELFGRFYSSASREFRPLGFNSDSCKLTTQGNAPQEAANNL